MSRLYGGFTIGSTAKSGFGWDVQSQRWRLPASSSGASRCSRAVSSGNAGNWGQSHYGP